MVRVLIVSHNLTSDKLTGRKFWKIIEEETKELQKFVWYNERFGRE